jgi:hypothetical protein
MRRFQCRGVIGKSCADWDCGASVDEVPRAAQRLPADPCWPYEDLGSGRCRENELVIAGGHERG